MFYVPEVHISLKCGIVYLEPGQRIRTGGGETRRGPERRPVLFEIVRIRIRRITCCAEET
jgi:hypothetical protein